MPGTCLFYDIQYRCLILLPTQIYLFKPVQVTVSTVFLLLLIYSFGQAWAAFLPRKSWVEGTRLEWLGPTLHVINPGPFGLKEVCHNRVSYPPLVADIVHSTSWHLSSPRPRPAAVARS